MDPYPPVDHPTIAPRARNQNSRITNQPQKPAVSGRTALGRRVRDLAETFAHELGGWDKLDGMQAASVRCAAEMVALFEKARADALHEGRADPDALVRLAGAANRAVKALGRARKQRERDDALSSAFGGLTLPARERYP